jgi:uncharacterized membrane protein YphA (DoxX/SURF4 family)
MPDAATVANSEPPRADLAGWVLRVILALLFIVIGLQKFPAGTMWVRLFARIGFGQWFRYATGIVEAGGGLLLLIPQATVVAVPLLTCTMIGALLVHVFIVGVGPQSVAVAVLLVGVVAIGWRRRRRRLGV